VWWEFTFWGGKIFVFDICLKQIFPSTTKSGRAQKFRERTVPERHPVATGLVFLLAPQNFLQQLFFGHVLDFDGGMVTGGAAFAIFRFDRFLKRGVNCFQLLRSLQDIPKHGSAPGLKRYDISIK